MKLLEAYPDFGRSKMPLLRASLALLIVADHLTFWTDAAWLRPFRELGAPIVSLFLFISGYGLMKSYMSRGKAYLDGFFRKRLWKVILPSLLALAVYWIICFDPSRDYVASMKLLLTNGVPLLPYSWYVAAIVILYLAFYVCFRFLPRKFASIGVVVLSVVYILVTKGIGYDRCWWVGTLAFPTGLLFAEYEERLNKGVLSKASGFVLSVVGILVITAALYMTGSEYAFILCYIFIPLFVVLIYSRLNVPFKDSAVVAFLSGISYEIYLCQGIAMEFLRPMITMDIAFIVSVYLVVILLAFIVSRIARLLYRP